MIIEKISKFIEDNILIDEIDGIERTMVEFNFTDWIRFKRANFENGEEIEMDPINSGEGIKQRDQAREKMLKKVEKEKLPKKMHEIIAEKDPHKKRKRRTKTEMDAFRNGEQNKEQSVRKPRTHQTYPEEMKDFCERHMNQSPNKQLSKLVNEKFGLNMTPSKMGNYLWLRKLKRGNPNQQREERKVKKKIGKPKKYTDEVVQFLRDNINNFSNKQLCEELESQFNIKINVENLAGVLSQRGIKRDTQTGVDQEIMEFISKSKIKDAYAMRDKIIEKFEKDVPITKLRNLMSQRENNLPGEEVKDEVKRIEGQREFIEDEDVDELELDD